MDIIIRIIVIMDIIQIIMLEIKKERANQIIRSSKNESNRFVFRTYFFIFNQYILLAIFIKIWYTYCKYVIHILNLNIIGEKI